MKKIVICFLSICSLIISSSITGDVKDSSTLCDIIILEHPNGFSRYVKSQLIVQPSDDISIAQFIDHISDLGFIIPDTNTLYKYGFAAVLIPADQKTLEVYENNKHSHFFKSVSLNYLGEVYTNDTYFGDQWALERLKAEDCWNKYTKGDSNIVIAILDSGYSAHEDIDSDCITLGENFTNSPVWDDSLGHATGMVGVIGAACNNSTGIAGLVWNPELLIVKVARKQEGIDDSAVTVLWAVNGILSVVDTAEANPDKRYIINCSLGFKAPEADSISVLADAIEDADDNNILVVAAAGKLIDANPPRLKSWAVSYPARLSGMNIDEHYCNVISVGAVDSCYDWAPHSPFSGGDSVGDTCDIYIDISGPSCVGTTPFQDPDRVDAIKTLSSDSYTSYKMSSGTSIAAAHVSGVAALVWSIDPTLTHYEVKHILKSTATNNEGSPGIYYGYNRDWCDNSVIESLCGHTYEYNNKIGAGIVSAYNAVDAVTKNGLMLTTECWSGEIVVGGDIIVGSSSTLTIEEGTTITIFDNDFEASGSDTNKVEFIIHGNVVCGESGGSEVEFKAYPNGGTEKAVWIGFKFQSSSSGNEFYNTSFYNADTVIAYGSDVLLEGCSLDSTNNYPMYLNDNLVLDSCGVWIPSDMEVASGDTLSICGKSILTISPPDESDYVEFIVNGRLEIDGNPSGHIEFKSGATNPSVHEWNGIDLNSGSSYSTFKCCDIYHADTAIVSADDIILNKCILDSTNCYPFYFKDNATIDSSVVFLSSDYIIESGDTFSVTGNTTFYMGTEDLAKHWNDTTLVEFWNFGVLDINGDAADKVEFKSASASTYGGDWYGIKPADSTVTTTLNNCKISDAVYGIKSSVTVTLRNVDITNSAVTGIYLYENENTGVEGNESTLDTCTFNYNDSTDASGMQIWNCDSLVMVDNCEVNYNGHYGMWVSNASPDITCTKIQNNGNDGLHMGRSSPSETASPYVYRCEIEDNGDDGIYFGFCGGYIRHTKILDNATNGAYCMESNAKFKRSEIEDNPTGVRVRFLAVSLGDPGDTLNTGYCSLDNTYYNVHFNCYFPFPALMAQDCWWGADPPSAAKMNGNIDYSDWLEDKPTLLWFTKTGNQDSQIPTKVMLYQNFPNPLVGGNSTQIKFSLPKAENVSITVYDVAGRKVKTLASGIKQPGHHYIRWDGHNDKGARVATGIYFYQMKVGSKVMSKKIVLLR